MRRCAPCGARPTAWTTRRPSHRRSPSCGAPSVKMTMTVVTRYASQHNDSMWRQLTCVCVRVCAACVLNTAWASFPELSLSTAIPEGHVHIIALVNSPLSSPVASTLSGSLTSEDSRASQATTKGTAEARVPLLLRRSPERPRAQGALHERVPIQDWSVREPRN